MRKFLVGLGAVAILACSAAPASASYGTGSYGTGSYGTGLVKKAKLKHHRVFLLRSSWG